MRIWEFVIILFSLHLTIFKTLQNKKNIWKSPGNYQDHFHLKKKNISHHPCVSKLFNGTGVGISMPQATDVLKVNVAHSCLTLSNPHRTVARQALLSRGLPRQEYWSGFQFPSPGELPDPGIEPSPAWKVESLPAQCTHTVIWCFYLKPLLLSRFSHVRLFVTLWTVARQGL